MNQNKTRQLSLPPVPANLPPEMDRFLRGVYENLNVLLGTGGDPQDAAVRKRELTDKQKSL